MDPIDIASIPPIDREEMVGLATREYARLVALLRGLGADDWDRPTACEGWSVRHMAGHLLGAAAANASVRENARQVVRGALQARRMGGRPLVDGINEVQIADRAGLTTTEVVAGLERIAGRAVRGRRRTPTLVRRLPVPSPTGGTLTLGHLVDVVYTRDQWMHRVDLCRATDREPELDPTHDGRIVADIVRDWATAHGQPVDLQLTGPAGGRFVQGEGGPSLALDAVDLCLAVSGREPANGLLAVPVVF